MFAKKVETFFDNFVIFLVNACILSFFTKQVWSLGLSYICLVIFSFQNYIFLWNLKLIQYFENEIMFEVFMNDVMEKEYQETLFFKLKIAKVQKMKKNIRKLHV